MSPTFAFILLILALLLPVVGAWALRFFAARLTSTQLYLVASVVFGVTFVGVLLLARSEVSSLQVGNISILLPVSGPAIADVDQPLVTNAPAVGESDDSEIETTVIAEVGPQETVTPAGSPESIQTITQTAEPITDSTEQPDVATAIPPTEEPTAEPEEEPTPEPEEEPTATPVTPPTAEPDEPETPAGQQTYVVESGDTLSGIAEQFGVSVSDIIDANGLTSEEADSLQIGQELIIP